MKELALRFWRWLFPLPEVGALEAFLARAMMAYGLWYFFPVFMQHTGQPVPVGLAHWFDLTWLHDADTFALYRKIFAAALVIYAAGVALPVTVALITIMHILPWTLHNSQGFTFHSHQIMSLTLMAQTATVWWLAGRKTAGWLQPSSKTNQWLLFNSQFAIATAYFVSVCSKMIRSDWQWFQNSHYVALDFVKTMRQNYYSSLDPQYAVDPPLVAFFMEHALLAACIFSFGVVLETVLVLVIGQRFWGLVIGVMLVLMHRGIAQMMNLFFPTHEFMQFVYFINVPFLVAWMVGRLTKWHRLSSL
jgi:hypothetical protein